ncbi:DNA primase family protein [Terricaulis silvestris]|uniref:SF3 helicase domain-containing protein n=1 Tax=Terricaulis silvestris TaxID=2686094 RepID=A0A6I6MIG5_9CAUL|nr:phage/plasmid primase, P4 family [Terricaulis silvestris]QGZ94880.1 hypothetical protein DSM104635_01713 [Terricaulis silvestris]
MTTTTKQRRSAAELLGDPVQPTALDTIESAVLILGQSSGGDTSNGFEFYQRCGGTTCYVPELKIWLAFVDGVWSPTDPETLMQAFCADLVREAAEQYRDAKRGAIEDAKRALSRAGQLFDDRRIQERALKQARPHMSISSARFNRTPHLLGVANGVLNLKTLKLVMAPASEYISKRMGCVYDPHADAPMWNRFICEVLPNADERELLQRAIGAALFGVILDRAIVFLLGESGANGKSVLCNVLSRLFGDYHLTASADLLLQTKHDSDYKRELTALSMGARFVSINELPKHAVWDDKKIRDIASKDDLAARRLYGESFSFTPTHHVFVRGNFAPGSQDSSDAFWGRIIPVPFDVQIPRARQIGDLDEKIAARELAGVLNWALDGARAWRADGEASGSLGKLILPKVTIDTRERYRAKTDYVARWLGECTEEGDDFSEARPALFASYRDFCHASGLRNAGLDRELFDELEKRGFRRGARKGVRVLRGLRLRDERFT